MDVIDSVSYELVDDAGGLFAIDGSSGVVTLAGELDYENSTSHLITILARSTDGSASIADFSVNVLKIYPYMMMLNGIIFIIII